MAAPVENESLYLMRAAVRRIGRESRILGQQIARLIEQSEAVEPVQPQKGTTNEQHRDRE